jgi:hypothetical protein
MSRSAFDAVLASVPQDATAGKVTSRGVHYDPKIDVKARKYSDVPTHSDAPSKCVPVPNVPNFVNLTGRKFGRLTVVGYLGRLNPKNEKKSSWLCRCVCGDYATRKAASIKNPNNAEDCCAKCLAWRVTKRRYEREGARPVHDFFEPPTTVQT